MSLRKVLMASIDKVAKSAKAKMKPKAKPPVGADSDFGDSTSGPDATGKSTPGKPEATKSTPKNVNPGGKPIQ